MLYIAYLDEFGHIGPFVSEIDPKHKTHPVFGLGGIVIPHDAVRGFATHFFQIKNNLLKYELEKSGRKPAQWEKKGSSLYRTENIKKYKNQIIRATDRIINRIEKEKGYAIYVGTEKKRADRIDSKKLFRNSLLEIIKRIDEECEVNNNKFMIIIDKQEGQKFRHEIVECTGRSMFQKENRRSSLIEPPLEAESHLYQTLQCADWICALFGRMTEYDYLTSKQEELAWFHNYFKDNLMKICKRSGVRNCFENPPKQEQLKQLMDKFRS